MTATLHLTASERRHIRLGRVMDAIRSAHHRACLAEIVHAIAEYNAARQQFTSSLSKETIA